jgi:hypothetical protein
VMEITHVSSTLAILEIEKLAERTKGTFMLTPKTPMIGRAKIGDKSPTNDYDRPGY